MRIGFIALTDAVPLLVAQARGFFSRQGARVELYREIGWATIRDKLIYGELDAVHAPAPMLWSAQLGVNCPACDVLTAFVLSRNGNAVTLAQSLWDAGVHDDTALRAVALKRRRRQPLTFGVVFPFSSHHLLLRRWLQGAGLDPDRDVRIVVVPPAQMFRNLAAGTLDGFCAGEPWNTLAIRERVGWCRLCSVVAEPGHFEKVLMVTRAFAENRASEHAAVVRALHHACAWCDDPANREAMAALLSAPEFLNMPPAVIAPALTGHFDLGNGRTEDIPDFHVFHRGDANVPALGPAESLQGALVGAGLLPAALDPQLPRQLFREHLYREILNPPIHDAFVSRPDLRGVLSA